MSAQLALTGNGQKRMCARILMCVCNITGCAPIRDVHTQHAELLLRLKHFLQQPALYPLSLLHYTSHQAPLPVSFPPPVYLIVSVSVSDLTVAVSVI